MHFISRLTENWTNGYLWSTAVPIMEYIHLSLCHLSIIHSKWSRTEEAKGARLRQMKTRVEHTLVMAFVFIVKRELLS